MEEVTSAAAAAERGLSIFDVVLPLPGERVVYPRNLRDFYEVTAREKLGLELDQFRVGTQ